MQTLPQDNGQHKQPTKATDTHSLDQRLSGCKVSEDAARRIRVAAAVRHVPIGRVISDLALQHLPAVEAAA